MTAKERYATDPNYREEVLAVNREWFAKNKERRAAYNRTRRKNPVYLAEQKAKLKLWHEKNGDRHKANCRRWYAENREARKQSKAVWHKANPGRHRIAATVRRERLQGAGTDRESLNILQQLIEAAPRLRCGICRKNMPRNDRTIDHIIPLVRGGTGNIGNLRVVHRVCNSRKSVRMPEDVTGQYEMNFAGNGAQPNAIRTSRAMPIHFREADELTDCSLADIRRETNNN